MVKQEGLWHYLDISISGQRLRRVDCCDRVGIEEHLHGWYVKALHAG